MEKDENIKPWERPWSTDEIREHSANWNLAGDAGLLNHLQQFSQNLLARTHATQVAMDKLLEDMKTSSIQIQNVMNSFLSLANTQFVENRVYDDDDEKESPPEKKEEVDKVKSKEQQEAEFFQKVKDVLDTGMSFLESHFETVEVPASDSEDDESSASVGRLVFKPHSMYLSRPLPYLIGSKEFMEDDKVGLGDISSDTEESPDQNILQSSESDEEMEQDEAPLTTKRSHLSLSSDTENSEPESDRGGPAAKQRKQHNGISTRESVDTGEESDMFGRESPSEADEIAVKANPDVFAAELANKLSEEAKRNKKENKSDGNIFVSSSEIDEDNSLFGYTTKKLTGHSGSSAGGGLFDDLDDWNDTSNSLWKEVTSTETSNKSKKESSQNSKPSHSVGESLFGSNIHSENLFDDEQNDDLFSTLQPKLKDVNPISNIVKNSEDSKSHVENITSASQDSTAVNNTKPDSNNFNQNEDNAPIKDHIKNKVVNTNSSLFEKDAFEEDEDLFTVPSAKTSFSQPGSQEKSVGGNLLFDHVNLFGDISPVNVSNSSESTGNIPNTIGYSSQDSGKGSGIVASGSSLWNEKTESQIPSTNNQKKISLFDDSDDNSSTLFQPLATSTQEKTSSGLFNENHKSDSLFSTPKFQDALHVPKEVSSKNVASSLGTKSKKTESLFDDSDSGDDELLFSSTSSTSSRSRRSQGSGDLLSGSIDRKILPKKNLLNDDLLFGNSHEDEPGFDIFSTLSTKSSITTKPASEDKVVKSNKDVGDVSVRSSTGSNLFDNTDDTDDIFATPKQQINENVPSLINAGTHSQLESSLFSDINDDVDDIFTQKRIDNKQKVTISEPEDISFQNHFKREELSTPEPSEKLGPPQSDIQKIDSNVIENVKQKSNISEDKTSSKLNKPVISQKPKVAPRKPSLSSKAVHSHIVESLNTSVPCMSDIVPNTDTEKKKSEDQNSKSDMNIVNVPSAEFKVNNSISAPDRASVSILSTPSSKPKPPSTLNIRKTTELLFDSPSNDDELFAPSWTEKLSDERISSEQSEVNTSALSSSTLSALLEDYGSGPTSDSTGSIDKNSLQKETQSTKQSDVISKITKGIDSGPNKLSPGKLLIDPRTLLPGTKPQNSNLSSETAISFDKPAGITTLHSAGKERAKIQVKRRPPSRRARQEAIRASSIEYDNVDAALTSHLPGCKNKDSDVLPKQNDSVTNNIHAFGVPSKCDEKHPEKMKEDAITDFKNKNLQAENSFSACGELNCTSGTVNQFASNLLEGTSNPLSPSTDEEDLFGLPQDLPCDDVANKDQSSNVDKCLFGGAPVLSPLTLKLESTLFEKEDFSNVESDKSKRNDEMTGNTSGPLKSAGIFGESGKTDQDPLTKPMTKNPEIENLFDDNVDDLFLPSQTSRNSSFVGPDVKSNTSLYDDDNLFSSAKGLTNNEQRDIKHSQLFASEDSKLFSSKNSDAFKSQNKGSLFSPSDSDTEDLFMFGSKTVISKNSTTEKNVEYTLGTTDIHKREENIDVFSSDQVHRALIQKGRTDVPSSSSNTSSHAPLISQKVTKSNDRKQESSRKSNKSERMAASSSFNLFGDESPESEDLFSSLSATSKKPPVNTANVANIKKLKETEKNSLFDDPSEDEDIFTLNLDRTTSKVRDSIPSIKEDKTADKKSNGLSGSKSVRSKNQGSTSTKNLMMQNNEEPFEDPLMVVRK